MAGESGQGKCRMCWLRLNKRAATLARYEPRPCEHLGAPTGETADCASCGGGTADGKRKQVPLYACTLHGVCAVTRARIVAGGVSRAVICCRSCPDYSTSWPKRFDEQNLWPVVPGKRFNPGIVEYEGGYLLAARNGWTGSEVYLGLLDASFRPIGEPWRLNLRTLPDSNYGAEDPRLLIHDGAVHVFYVGVAGGTKITRTNVMYARLNRDLLVEHVFAPRYTQRRPLEKNWSPFSHDGELLAVYSVAPHRIVRLSGDKVELLHETPNPASWAGGEMRGGAPPVRVGDEYRHFMHDRVTVAGVPTYRTGLYCFEAKAPFRVTRSVTEPILGANTQDKPKDQYASVAFCCGAVRTGDQWILSHGRHDRWTTLDRISHVDLEKRLTRVSPPAWWSGLGEANEAGCYAWIHSHDEYRVRKLNFKDGAVLDVGAHVGSFAHLATELGTALVHCYEPNPPAFKMLEKNASRMPVVTCFPQAVGAEAGTGRMTYPSEESTSAVVVPGEGDVSFVTLDEAVVRLASASPDGRVRLIKLDCEGAEGPALGSCTRLGLVDAVAGEYHPPVTTSFLQEVLTRAGFRTTFAPAQNGCGLFFGSRAS